jgi:hypothetical protein
MTFAAALLLNIADPIPGFRRFDVKFVNELQGPGHLCQMPADLPLDDWPLSLREVFPNTTKIEKSTNARAYHAYSWWCNPIMCTKVTKKGNYMRSIQGLAAFGGMWSIITLAILVLWQCLFLGCVVGHQQQRAVNRGAGFGGGGGGDGGGGGVSGGGGGVSGGGEATPADASMLVGLEAQSMKCDSVPADDKV